MFWNGSALAWKVIIHATIFCVTLAAICTAIRSRLRRGPANGIQPTTGLVPTLHAVEISEPR